MREPSVNSKLGWLRISPSEISDKTLSENPEPVLAYELASNAGATEWWGFAEAGVDRFAEADRREMRKIVSRNANGLKSLKTAKSDFTQAQGYQ